MAQLEEQGFIAAGDTSKRNQFGQIFRGAPQVVVLTLIVVACPVILAMGSLRYVSTIVLGLAGATITAVVVRGPLVARAESAQ
jgi:hypothetical protein